jgi:hypothetical protein
MAKKKAKKKAAKKKVRKKAKPRTRKRTERERHKDRLRKIERKRRELLVLFTATLLTAPNSPTGTASAIAERAQQQVEATMPKLIESWDNEDAVE